MPAGNMHVTLAVHVPVAAAILFAPCAGTADSLQTAAWAERVLSPTDAWSPKVRDAATWASKLSPLADLSVVDLRCAFTAMRDGTCFPCRLASVLVGCSRVDTACRVHENHEAQASTCRVLVFFQS